MKRSFWALVLVAVGFLLALFGAFSGLLAVLLARPMLLAGLAMFCVGVGLLIPQLYNSATHKHPGTAKPNAGEQWVRDELDFYSRWMRGQAFLFSVFRCLSLICTAAIPVVAAILKDNAGLWSTVLASVAVVAQGIQAVFKYHENWISGATTRGALDRELALYVAKVPPYSGDAKDASANESRLVANAVVLVGAEYSQWAKNLLSSDDKSQSAGQGSSSTAGTRV